MKSQLDFVILLEDGPMKVNIFQEGFTRCRTVLRSVLATEVHALFHAFDNGFVVREALEELLGRRAELEYFVDSRTLLNVTAENSITEEPRLQIALCVPKECCRKEKMQRIGWIPYKDDTAEVLTKEILSQNSVMWELVTGNEVGIDAIGWATFRKE